MIVSVDANSALFSNLSEELRDKIESYMTRAIQMSDIYERNCGYGSPGSSQGYLNQKIEMTDRLEGFCTALFLLGLLEYPLLFSANNGTVTVNRYDKDFTIRGGAVQVGEFRLGNQ